MKPSINTNDNDPDQEKELSPMGRFRVARMSQADFLIQQTIQAADLIAETIYEDTEKVSDEILYNHYLPGLMAEDEDQAEYYRKKLGEYVGGIYRPFYIYDSQTGETLFYVHGCAVRIGTTNYGDQHENINSMTSLFKNEITNPLFRFQSVKDQFNEEVESIGEGIIDSDVSISLFYYGWYEIFDYFGVLTSEDEEVYRSIRQQRDTSGIHVFWVNKTPLKDYLQQHGTYLQRRNILQNTTSKTDENNKSPVTTEARASVDIDISDWE